jgi:HPt (histidine-containing phosphotransfer) domain-containing protein
LDLLEKIDGISTEVGVERVNGLKDVYLKTIEIFTRRIKPDCEKMRVFLDAEDLTNFTVAIHGMKTSLQTVGAMKLAEAAYILEMAAKGNDLAFCVQKFPAFSMIMDKLHGQLFPLMPLTGETIVRKGAGTVDYFIKTANEAAALVDEFEMDAALEALKKLLVLDFGEQLNRLAERASDSLNDFDFEAAAEHLNNALKIAK